MSHFDPSQGQPPPNPQQPPQQPGWQQQPPQQPGQQPPQQPGWQQQPGQQQPGWQQQPGQQQPGWQQQPGQPFGGQSYQSSAKKSPLGRIALAAALVLVLGIGGLVVFKVLGDTAGGAATPAEAVAEVVTALDNEDFLTIGESLAPNEREAMFEPSLTLVTELERLDVVEDGAMDGDFGGLDITITDVDPRIEPVTDKISWVTIDSGTVTVITTPSELPVGDLISEDVVNQPQETEVTNLAEEPIKFAVVEEEGRWYVSIYYSIAEAVRREAGKPIPNPAAAPAPVGSVSPEAVIEDMTKQLSDLNGQGVVALMDPEEFKAAYEYGSLYLPDIQANLDSIKQAAQEQDTTWSLDQVTSRTEERNGDTVVIITNISFSATVEGESLTAVWDGQCFKVSGVGDAQSFCRQDVLDELDANDPVRGLIGVDYGFRVVERDGRWYLSGYPTLVGGYTDGLSELSPEQLRQLFDSNGDDLGGVGGLLDQVEGITI